MRAADFNCTIQELKQGLVTNGAHNSDNFNCTIQELKRREYVFMNAQFREFQLHHTGIKTSTIEVVLNAKGSISIAPYRN